MNSPKRKAEIKGSQRLKLQSERLYASICIPVVLTIAGSDNSGGAGIQADLKTFTTLGTYGTSAITSVVAEHPGRVKNITPIPPARVVDQIRLVREAFPLAAAKTGMLFSQEIIVAVARELKRGKSPLPLVIDPVMVASSGAPLLKKDAIAALQKELLPLAILVTPNLDEAALLWGKPIRNLETLRCAGIELSLRYGVPFLVKGGHLRGTTAVDLLCIGDRVRSYETKMIRNVNPHGTGCTLSAAITASLARGLPLPQAVAAAKKFITRAVRHRFRLGSYDVLNVLPF